MFIFWAIAAAGLCYYFVGKFFEADRRGETLAACLWLTNAVFVAFTPAVIFTYAKMP